jgi:hypothetical protein
MMIALERILLATDFSETSQIAAQHEFIMP